MRNVDKSFKVKVICNSGKLVEFNNNECSENVIIERLKKQGEIIKKVIRLEIRKNK